MRRQNLLTFGVALAGLATAVFLYAAFQNATPSRWLGYESEQETQSGPSPDAVLGFSRYLPEETDLYVSVLQLGRIWKGVADSKAAAILRESPEIQKIVNDLRRELEPSKLPPDAEEALGHLAEVFDSEAVLAVPSESVTRGMELLRMGLLSLLTLIPVRVPPDSIEEQMLALKRAPFRKAWIQGVAGLRFPSLVFAARVRDETRFDAFVRRMVDKGWLELRSSAQREPPRVRSALEKALSAAKIGGRTFQRIRLRLGDLIEPSDRARAMRDLDLSPAEEEECVRAVGELALDIHVGFLGEYFTIVLSSDDSLVRKIVDCYEGRSKATLAASKSFEEIRARVSENTVAILHSDASQFRKAMRDRIVPLLRQAADPEFLALLGAPPQAGEFLTRVVSESERELEGG